MFLLFIVLATSLGIYGTDLQKSAEKLHVESLHVSLGSPSLIYSFSTGSDAKEIAYGPEVTNYLGLEISTKRFSLGITHTDGKSSSDEEEEADYRSPSKVSDVQLFGVKNQFLWNAFYQKYQGFYLDSEDETVQRSLKTINATQAESYELSAERMGLGVLYAFNDVVSLEHLVGSSALTRETGSSWLLGANINRENMKSEGTIIPAILNSHFKELKGVKGINSHSINIEGGWLGQYVWDKVYVNGIFTAGAGIQNQEILNGNTTLNSSSVSVINITIDTGYRFSTSMLGFNLNSFNQSAAVGTDTQLQSSRTSYSFYYRYFF